LVIGGYSDKEISSGNILMNGVFGMDINVSCNYNTDDNVGKGMVIHVEGNTLSKIDGDNIRRGDLVRKNRGDVPVRNTIFDHVSTANFKRNSRFYSAQRRKCASSTLEQYTTTVVTAETNAMNSRSAKTLELNIAKAFKKHPHHRNIGTGIVRTVLQTPETVQRV
jgi:hypothetical protein